MYCIGKLNSKYSCKKFYKINYIKKTKKFSFQILDNVIKEEEKWDGFIVLQSSDKTLINENSLELYKNLIKVKSAFKYLKADLNIRPIYHRNETTIKGHIYICIIAYLIENYISWILKQKNNITTKPLTILQELSTIAIIEKKVDGKLINFELTETSNKNKKILNYFNLSVTKLEKIIGKTFTKKITR
jgi:transposase